MHRTIRSGATLLMASLIIASCELGTSGTYALSTRPYFQRDVESGAYYCLPWNYDAAPNYDRDYPLVVFLHGSGGAGNISYLNYLGYQDPATDSLDTRSTAYRFQKERPSFVVIPQTSGGWDNAAIIALIERFKAEYRIDDSRLYLIGYSMGGSGGYALANEYYDYNGSAFAGIVRLAGQSQTALRDGIVGATSVWMHIGLEDTEERVRVTKEAFGFLAAHERNQGAATGASAYYLGKTLVDTKTVTRNGIEVAKESEYAGTGHGIVMLPYHDPAIMDWLYDQRAPE